MTTNRQKKSIDWMRVTQFIIFCICCIGGMFLWYYGQQSRLSETLEAKPFWCRVDAIPYNQMWADDVFWLPGMLKGQKFDAEFIFDGEVILWSDLRWR